MQPKIVLFAAGTLLLGLMACSDQTTTAQSYRPVATIQELMDAQVDPAADAIWESVASIVTDAGIEERQPRTEEEWEAVKQKAFLVIEGANLLAMPGRHVAPAGKALDPEELASEKPEDIEKAIAANRAAFDQLAFGLHDAGMEVLSAINAKSTEQLLDAGAKLDEACEACHSTFWYPNQPPLLSTYEDDKGDKDNKDKAEK